MLQSVPPDGTHPLASATWPNHANAAYVPPRVVDEGATFVCSVPMHRVPGRRVAQQLQPIGARFHGGGLHVTHREEPPIGGGSACRSSQSKPRGARRRWESVSVIRYTALLRCVIWDPT